MWIILLLFALLFYVVLDVHYFVRAVVTLFIGKFFRSKLSLLQASEIYGICVPTDADLFLTHMNNSRFLREYDFARFDYFTRTGLLAAIMKGGGNFPVAAISARFRQPLWMFSPYKVVTTPVWWDNKALYLDQRIVTLKDNVVRSIGYTKVAIVKVDFDVIVQKLFPTVQKPSIPLDLQKWNDSNDISSNNMKKAN